MNVVIVGAGGHAQVVADILMCLHQKGDDVNPIGYVDDAGHLQGRKLLDLPVLGTIRQLPGIHHDAVVIAIGDNRLRFGLYRDLRSAGERFFVARHPNTIIAADVQIGPGCMICAGVIVNTGTVINENVILNTSCTIDHHNRIGSHVHIAPGCHLGGEVGIEEGTLVGIGASIMPRCKVGPWSTVGAGALVHRDLPGFVTAVGVPARVLPGK